MQKKVIALSLFGYNHENKDCHSFNAFIRFLSITIRAYNTLFWDWEIYLAVDKESYNAYREYFDYLKENNIVMLEIFDRQPLCRSMLWRLNPIGWADYTICRDIDSLPTYRELQATMQWIKNDTVAHSMNDSLGHTIPLLGGMVGFKKHAFSTGDIDNCRIDYSVKGADQDYLNQVVYPIVSNNITEHRVIGMPVRPENPYSYNIISDYGVDISKVDDIHSASFFSNPELIYRADRLCNHLGQGGFHIDKTRNDILDRTYEGAYPFWSVYGREELNIMLLAIENKYPEIFYWTKN